MLSPEVLNYQWIIIRRLVLLQLDPVLHEHELD
jgi:hypothetical protein